MALELIYDLISLILYKGIATILEKFTRDPEGVSIKQKHP